jgi:hypothetical protein
VRKVAILADHPSGPHLIQCNPMEPAPTVLPLDWLKNVVELGSFGLLAWTIIWWVSKEMPKRDAAFLESLAQQRADCQKDGEQERADYLHSIETARKDYLDSATRLWDMHIKAQEQQRTDYLAASKQLATEHWAQLEKQRTSYEERARLDREGVERRAEAMIRAIQGLGDVIVGREVKNLPNPPGPGR